MKKTNSNFEHNLSKNSLAISVQKLLIYRKCPEFWVTLNPASPIQIVISWAKKLQIELFKKEIKAKTIRNNFDEGHLAKFLQ